MIRNLKKPLIEDVPADDFFGVDQEPAASALQKAGSCSSLLTRLLLDEAMTPEIRRRVEDESGIAVLLEAPTAAWVPHLRRALAQAATWGHLEGRDGTYQTRRKPTDGAAELVEAVAAGQEEEQGHRQRLRGSAASLPPPALADTLAGRPALCVGPLGLELG